MIKGIICTVFLSFLLLTGCTTELATEPESTVNSVNLSTHSDTTSDVVTLLDLQSNFGNTEAASGPDVAVTAFYANPTNLLPGDVLTLTATITNLGTAAAIGPFYVWIGLLDSNFEFVRVTVNNLAAGEVRSGVVDFTVPAEKLAKAVPPGTYTLYCTHGFGDSNPTNNYKLDDVLLGNPSGDTEVIRLYFDDSAFCTEANFLDHVRAYIVYDNPTLPAIRGFECGFDITTPGKDIQVFNTNVSVTYPTPAIDVGLSSPPDGTYNYIVGYGSPLVVTGTALTLGTLDIFYLDMSTTLEFTLRASIPSSDPLDLRPVVVRENFSEYIVELGQVEGSPSLVLKPTGTGGDCPVVQKP
ncbi:MAG: hypothetical protein ABIK96_08780 [bacterium]